MKASKMTNEQIADAVESSFCASSSPFGAMMREAAARLRIPTPVDDDLLKMAKDVDAKNAEIAKLRTLTTYTDNSKVIAELQRRLKVAEDALESIAYEGIDDYSVVADAALAAIRGEGGAE